MVLARLSKGFLLVWLVWTAVGCVSRHLDVSNQADLFFPVHIDSNEMWDIVDVDVAKTLVDSTKPQPYSEWEDENVLRWWYSGTEDGYCFFSRTRLKSMKTVPARNMAPIDGSWIAIRVKAADCDLPEEYANMAFGDHFPIPVFTFIDEKGKTSYRWDRKFGFDDNFYQTEVPPPETIKRIAKLGLDYRNYGFAISHERIELSGVGLVYDRNLLFLSEPGTRYSRKYYNLFAIHDNGDKFYFRRFPWPRQWPFGYGAVYKISFSDSDKVPQFYKASIREYLDEVWIQHCRSRSGRASQASRYERFNEKPVEICDKIR